MAHSNINLQSPIPKLDFKNLENEILFVLLLKF